MYRKKWTKIINHNKSFIMTSEVVSSKRDVTSYYNDQLDYWELGSRKSSNKINDGESLNRKRHGQYCQRYLESS